MGTLVISTASGLIVVNIADGDGAVPSAPSSLTATAISASRIDLAWTDTATDETGFVVERAPDVAGSPGTFVSVATPAANATTYSNTGLTAETKYHYRAKATNAAGSSSYSNTATATTEASDPGTLDATHNLTAGWATFGQTIPEGAVSEGSAIQVGSLDTQCDVKTTWPDGSARFAVLTCEATTTADQTLSVVAAGSGTFTPTIPTASVVLTIGGTAWTAALPGSVSGDLWLSGPQVKEWRSVVTPINGSSTPHAFLRVYFDVRVYSDGQARVDVTVENCLNVSGATKVTYDVTITVDGESVFTQADVAHAYMARWRKVFGIGLTESTVTLDFEPVYVAGAVPRYVETIANDSYSTAGEQFEILKRGGNTYDAMGSTGGRVELAPYPNWTAQFLIHRSASQREYTIANGDLAGSWPLHVRESDGGLVSIVDRPRFWLDTRGQGEFSNVPEDDQPKGDLSTDSTGPLIPDLAHVPSLSYIPYLVTGDRYLCDEMAFWGNFALVGSWWGLLAEDPELGGRGEDAGIIGTDQVRARAWGLRNLVDATAYLPDDHPSKSYFTAKIAGNLAYFDARDESHSVPLGTIFERPMYTSSIDMSVWMNNYLAWSIDHAEAQGFTGGLLVRNRIVAFQLSLFTNAPDYAREQAAPYYLTVATIALGGDIANPEDLEFFTTMAELYEENFSGSPGQDPFRPFAGEYGVDARISLILAIKLGLTGAQEAYDWLIPQISTDINVRAGWSIKLV